ncbi:MAG: hypothetical protein II304_08010 [Bacteroidales bacterium]|nr:hypothetical protein [Bacteroidales bacterium]
MNIPIVQIRNNFDDEFDYVLCTHYGTNGIIPTRRKCNGACVSSSGDSMCGCCKGYKPIPDTNLYIVKCNGDMYCCKT